MRVTRRLALLALAFAAAACAESAQARRYSREKLNRTLTSLETPGVTIGEFELSPKAVTDGDTIRVEGLESSLRLIALDCEETFKNNQDRLEADADFDAYLRKKRGDSRHPVKAASPMGEQAKLWAKEFLSGVTRVRLERDHPKEIRDRFNRYLAYAWIYKDGKWLNFNIESVRAGMSPYFTKYSYSRRFHTEFVAAEKEARQAKRGIWDPEADAYPDYPERKKWWDGRAEFIKAFEAEAHGREDHVVLSQWDAIKRIEANLGKEITILGTVGEIRYGDRGPTRVLLSRRMFDDFPVIFFDKDVFLGSRIAKYKGEFVRVTGVVNIYENKYNHKKQLQVMVNLPSQVAGPPLEGDDGDDGDDDAGLGEIEASR